MIRSLASACLSALLATAAVAEGTAPGVIGPRDLVSPRLATFQAGIICAQDITDTRPAPGTIAGITNVLVGEPDFVSTGRSVPAVIGVGFGVKSTAQTPLGYDSVIITVTHPPMGPNGVSVETYDTSINGVGAPNSMTFFQFDQEYELAIGTWTITASEGGKPLFSATFDVMPPQLVPDLAAVCGYQNLLS